MFNAEQIKILKYFIWPFWEIQMGNYRNTNNLPYKIGINPGSGAVEPEPKLRITTPALQHWKYRWLRTTKASQCSGNKLTLDVLKNKIKLRWNYATTGFRIKSCREFLTSWYMYRYCTHCTVWPFSKESKFRCVE